MSSGEKSNDKDESQSADADDTDDKDEDNVNMADISTAISQQLKKVPVKSILKPSSSFETTEKEKAAARAKTTKWDEMNIIATLHPADKDYGFMKIEEAPTRFESPVEEDEPDEDGGINAQLLADKIRLGADSEPKSIADRRSSNDSSCEEDETPEERAYRKEFEIKRKAHYNEFIAAKLARKMMDEDEDEDENEEDVESTEGDLDESDDEDQTDGKKKKTKKKKKTDGNVAIQAGTSNSK